MDIFNAIKSIYIICISFNIVFLTILVNYSVLLNECVNSRLVFIGFVLLNL
jgi:hypothetical protein